MSSMPRKNRSRKAQAREPRRSGPGLRTSYFVTCAPGLESVLHGEIKALKLARVERQVGGVYFEGGADDAMRANLELRTAVRVLHRVSRFQASTSDELYEGVGAIDWSQFLRPGGSFLVAAHSKDSELDHTLFIEQRVKDAICDRERERRGERPEVDKDDPDLRVHAHFFRDRCTISVDTSGDSLHKRGWRQFQGGAPLAETLAAGIVYLSGWDRRSPIVDPFCGSGTLLIEAALLAADVAPGLFRERFGFQAFPGHDESRWQRLRAAARDRSTSPGKLQLVGTDQDAEIVEGALENLHATGLEQQVSLGVARAEEFVPKSGWNGWIVTNPPYGERLGDVRELAGVYRRLGESLRRGASGYALALFSGNTELSAEMGIEFERRTALANGALPCELCCAQL